MSDPLYQQRAFAPGRRRTWSGTACLSRLTGEAHNPVCGDRVIVDLALEDGRVEDVRQETKACVLTQASASILGA